ncbi:hypothetical protein [Nocardioides sp. GXQ0305]|uniref:hypothetical protein n=1 Tax=Nocardioides sp. GXQ0305 TaxID=3423912 RepID=UPI003D7C7E75
MADHREHPVDETRTGDHAYTDDVVHTEDRREVVSREREEHGGVKVGSAFFGWLAATGMAVLLTGLAAAAGAAVSVATGNQSTAEAADAVGPPETVGLIGGIVLLAILFLSYYCGGYVAGRMARFDGIKQGIAVWVWAIAAAVVVGILGYFAGDEYNVLQDVDGFPRIPVGEGEVTTGGVIALVLVVLVTLIGAMAGGLAGMRFHRKVDRTGLGS